QVWEPIRGGEIRCHTIRVEDEGRFIEQALGLVLAHPYEVVHLSKPRMPNIILGLLYKLVWGARVIVDIDDEELTFVRASEPVDLRELPPLRDLDSQEWTEMAAGLAREFDKVRELDGSESGELLAAVVAEVLAVPGCGVSRGLGLLLAGLPSVESVWSKLGDKGILEVMDTSEQVETRPEIISCPIVLFTPYYKDKHRARQDELIYCLQKNIDCPEIERIVLLIDDGHEPELQSPKIEIVRLSSRATYLDWVRLTENRFSDRISVLANTDIYLDGSISRLREILSANANAFVALSRHDKEGSQETLHQNPYQSQDVWAVYGKYGFTASLKNDLRIPLGFPRCDNKVAYLFSVHGAKVYNPCHDIKIVHVHETQLRYYDKYGDTTVLGSVAWVYPSASLCQPSKLRISVWTLNPDDVEHLRINKSLISWKKKGKGQQVLESWEDALHRETVTAILGRSQERIRQFHNKHLGQRCVIIGNGPSLNEMDLSFLKDEICFGTNKIYLGFERWQFSPTYYVAVNPYVVEQSVNEIRKISCPKFIGNRGIPYFDSGDDMIFIKTFPAPKESFSKRPDLGLNEGCTVTYVAMQLAYYMGFSEVILIGVDHHFVTQGTPHKAIVSDGDDLNHFDPNYFAKGLTWQLPDLANSEKSYRVAKKVFEDSGRKIIDATVNGQCQVFPKEDYRFIFKNYLSNKLQLEVKELAQSVYDELKRFRDLHT
ncbi:6-hydroxymethylpterin diphosphokinase MptE-like protein, partial [Arthrospira platensis SPKY2]